MASVANQLKAQGATYGLQSITLYNASTDIRGPANAFNVQAGGATVFPEVMDITAGETSTRNSGIRFVRPTNGHTYQVNTSTRYVGGTGSLVWSVGNTNGYNGTNAYTFYSQAFSSGAPYNLYATYGTHCENGSYPLGVRIYVDGGLWVSYQWNGSSSGSSSAYYGSLLQGSHSINIQIQGQNTGGYNNYGWANIYIAL